MSQTAHDYQTVTANSLTPAEFLQQQVVALGLEDHDVRLVEGHAFASGIVVIEYTSSHVVRGRRLTQRRLATHTTTGDGTSSTIVSVEATPEGTPAPAPALPKLTSSDISALRAVRDGGLRPQGWMLDAHLASVFGGLTPAGEAALDAHDGV